MSEVLQQFRAENPAYKDTDDATLANALYDRFYAGRIPRNEYFARLGMQTAAPQAAPAPSANVEPSFLGKGVDAATDAIGRGMRLGYGDEIGAAIGAGAKALFTDQTFGQAYDEGLARRRAHAAQQRDEYPVTSFVGEALGGALTTAPLAAATAGKAGLGVMQQALRSGAVGAGTGAVQGFGEGEGGFEDRAVNSAKDAVIGGGFGLAAPFAVSALGSVGGKLIDVLGLRGQINADKIATQKILQAFEADGIDPATAAQKLKSWQQAGGPPAMLMDLGGQNVRDLARAAANYPLGGAKQAAQAAIDKRAGDQMPRIYNSIHRALNASDYDDMAQQMIANYGKKAEPLYRQAYAAPAINDPKLSSIVGRIQRFKPAAITNAMKMMEAEGIPIGTYDATGRLTAASTQYYDYLKRALDDVINSPENFNAINRKFNNTARVATKLKNELLGRVDAVNPDFKAARAMFADDASVRRALEDGRNFLNLNTIEIREVMKGLHSQAEKEAFQSGVARGLFEKVSGRSDAGRQNLGLAFDNADLIARVRAVFPAKQEADRFLAAMRNEAQAFRNQTHVSPSAGSRTTPLANDQAATFGGSVVEAMGEGRGIRSSITQAAGELARDNWKGVSSKLAEKMVDQLMSPNATQNKNLLNNLRLLSPQMRQKVIDDAVRRAVGIQGGIETFSAARE